MDERFAFVLQGLGTTVEIAGGKAQALDRLIAIGAPVPRCGVLTTAAYREFVATPSLAEQLAALRDEPLPAITVDDDARRRVDKMFLETPMTLSVRAAIEDLVIAVGGERGLAIRSSATAEDLGSVSFAGQYRSFLEVEPVDAERAVRLTWASLWHPAPRAYRGFHGVDERGLAMALIIMRMLAPVVAGVAFTREPSANSDAMRVELVHGLGEALVSGVATPEVFIVDRSGVNADLAAVAAPLAGLPALAAEIEDHFGAAQDLEWAVDGEHLWILQARPITASDREGTDDGFDVRPPSDVDCTTAGIAEMLPGVVPPRLWELDSWLVEEAFRRLFYRLGGDVEMLAEPHALLARYRARAALDLDAMRVVIRSIPGGSPAELEHEYFGDAAPAAAPVHSHAGLAQSLRLLRTRHAAVEESEIVVRVADLLLDGELDLMSVGDDELLAFAARVRDFAARAMASEVATAALATAAYRGVETLLARHFEADEAKQLTQRITGNRGVAKNALTASLAPLVEQAHRDVQPGETGDSADLAQSEVARASSRYREVIRRAGSRSVCGGPTWEEAPEQAWLTFQALLARPAACHLDESARREARADAEHMLHLEPRWRTARTTSGMLADPRRAFLRREADDAAELLERREQVKAALLMVGGIARRADLEISRRLVERGDLPALDDIGLLTFAESAQLLRRRGDPPCITPALIATRRRRLRSAELNGPLPRRFHGRTPPVARPVGAAIGRGWGASPGRYEGVARIVESPATAAGFRRGDVLVARTTDASWMPLFLMAGAMVVEEGGPLSHAAIVARELGVPTIVNVPGIVDRLTSMVDARVTVDGTSGEVTFHDQDNDVDHLTEPATGVAPTRSPPALEGVPALNVFVTGLIGMGALISVVMSLTERLGSVRARARLRRRAEPIAHTVSAAIIRGFDEVAASSIGLRSRQWYATVAALLFTVGVAISARSAVDYSQADPRSWHSVLAWSASSTSSLTMMAGAVVLANSALRWPAVGPPVRRLAAARSPSPDLIEILGPRLTAALAGALTLTAMLAVLVIGRVGLLNSFDRWLYDLIDAGAAADRYAPDWMNALGKPIVVIPLAVALAGVARRCRALALSIPTAIVGTGITVFALTWITMRDRPALGAHAGEQNSFPGGHVAQLTLLFGLLPLVVHVLIDRRWLGIFAAVTSSAILAVLLTDTVRTGGHWPTDQLAGLLIASAVLMTVAARVRAPACHSNCRDSCPLKGNVDDHHRAAV
jgi:phosphohistidine swiveling domain-containing protein